MMWIKAFLWIINSLNYISLFRNIFYISILILVTMFIIYGNPLITDNLNKMDPPFIREIYGYTFLYANLYIGYKIMFISVFFISDLFKKIGNSCSNQKKKIEHNKVDKNIILLKRIKYLLMLLLLIGVMILWRVW